MVIAGQLALVVALAGALGAMAGNWAVAHGHRAPRLLAHAHTITLAGVITAFVLLEVALFTDDFAIKFVVEHHRSTTPALYTFTSAWAGLEGSLLLWAGIIVTFVFVVARRVRRTVADGAPDELGAMAAAVMSSVAAFFVSLVLFVSPTFVRVPQRAEGTGANPLLQDNLMMAIHPPLLYTGYVGFLVPCSFAVAALWRRERGPRWVLRTQTWAVVAWTFLTAGILVGGWWSYEVLGWGGYWAWDPVENASFLPWLVGTAYLHSAVMQARRGLMPAWSVGLVLSTFVLTLLGTFLARSGVIASVHAFSGSRLGPVLLVYLVVVSLAVGWLFVTRLRDVVVGPPLESLASREGAFLLNNLLLAVFAAVVLVGTAYPIVVEAITGDRISVGRPFFDRFAIAIGLALMLALLIGAVAPHRHAGARAVWAALRLPVQVGLAVGAALVGLAGLRSPAVIVVVVIAGAIVANAVVLLVTSVRERVDQRGMAVATIGALRSRPGFWGGQLAHMGLAVVAVGITASSALATRANVLIEPGATATVAGYQLTYTAPVAAERATYDMRGASIDASRDGMQRTLQPEFRQYPNQTQPVGVPAVWTTSRFDDLYLAMLRLDENGVTLQVIRSPWIFLVWMGGILMASGGALGLGLRVLRSRANRAAIVAQLDAAASDDQVRA
jgi:cytochrome c-type biogenesis protein CcmF